VCNIASSHSHSYQQSRHTASGRSTNAAADTEDSTPSSAAADSASVPMFSRRRESRDDSPFADWLMRHVELALTHGFDDNVGRNPVPAVFELAALGDWFAVVGQLHHVFWADLSVDSRLHSHFIPLRSLSDADVLFSERFFRRRFS